MKKEGKQYLLLIVAVIFLCGFYLLSNGAGGGGDDAGGSSAGTVQSSAEVSRESDGVHYSFRKEEYLLQHFEKHAAEFDYATKEEYEAGANRVIAAKDALYKTEEEDGDHIYYLESTNEIVFVSKDGYIRTYFKPQDGIKYFNRQ